MAKINGVQLKAVKYFRGHEGESCLQANIYMDIKGKCKKIGSVSEDTWSGEYDVTFDKEEYEKEFNKRREDYFKTHTSKFKDNTIFLYELRVLTDREKDFKKYMKKVDKWNKEAGKEIYKPYLVYVLFDDGRQVRAVWECPSEKAYQQVLAEQKPKQHLVYSDLKEFIIE